MTQTNYKRIDELSETTLIAGTDWLPLADINNITKKVSVGTLFNFIPVGTGIPAGSDTYIQFNDNGVFGADSTLYFNSTTKTLYSSYYIGDGSGITNVDALTAVTATTADNAILWNNHAFSDYLDQSVKTTAYPSFNGVSLTGNPSEIKSALQINIYPEFITFPSTPSAYLKLTSTPSSVTLKAWNDYGAAGINFAGNSSITFNPDDDNIHSMYFYSDGTDEWIKGWDCNLYFSVPLTKDIRFCANADISNYIKFKTTTGIPEILSVSSQNVLKINAAPSSSYPYQAHVSLSDSYLSIGGVTPTKANPPSNGYIYSYGLECQGIGYFTNDIFLYGVASLQFFDSNNNLGGQIRQSNSYAQLLFATSSILGRQYVFCDTAVSYLDFDHATQANPTIFLHSATDPDTDNTQYLELSHDTTQGWIKSGKGTINFDNENLTTSGTITGINVTSGADPGHTHTTYIASIADPNINALFGWDDTDNAYKFITIGTNLSYDHTSHTLSATGGGSMTYPEAGIALSNGSGWGTSITNNSSNWNTSYGWGNHAIVGYLTSQVSHADVVVDGDFTSDGILKRTAAGVYGIITDASANWNTAYSWGNHASAGYLTSVTAHNLLSATHGDTLVDTVVRGDIVYGNSTPKWARLGFPTTPTGKILQATATDIAWSTNPITIGTSASVSGSNTGDQTLSGLGAQAQLNGTGFVKASGTNISYDNSTYVTGTPWTGMGYLTAAITSLGGLTGASQTFSIGTTGTAPAFSSATTVHTLNIPMAATAGVTAGLISKAEYDIFNAKQPAGSYLTNINSLSVNELSDVNTASPTPNRDEVLKWNGTNWVSSVYSASFAMTIISFADNQSATALIGAGSPWKTTGQITFTASYNNPPPNSASVACGGTGGVTWASALTLTTPFTSGASAENTAYPANKDTTVVFTLTAYDGATPRTSTDTTTFNNYIYYGASTIGSSFTEANVEALTGTISSAYSTSRSINAGANNYLVVAYPATYTSIHASGFIFNSVTCLFNTAETVSITNSAGFQENYKVFASVLANLGNSTLQLSTSASLINHFYYGGSTLNTGWTGTQIKALTDVKNDITNTTTGTWSQVALSANQYFVFAFPSRRTDPTLWYDHTSSLQLALKSLTPETVSIINENGYTENYDVFVSENILGPGNFTLRTT